MLFALGLAASSAALLYDGLVPRSNDFVLLDRGWSDHQRELLSCVGHQAQRLTHVAGAYAVDHEACGMDMPRMVRFLQQEHRNSTGPNVWFEA